MTTFVVFEGEEVEYLVRQQTTSDQSQHEATSKEHDQYVLRKLFKKSSGSTLTFNSSKHRTLCQPRLHMYFKEFTVQYIMTSSCSRHIRITRQLKARLSELLVRQHERCASHVPRATVLPVESLLGPEAVVFFPSNGFSRFRLSIFLLFPAIFIIICVCVFLG